MTPLERELVALGDGLAFPPSPDVSAAVLARVSERPRRLPSLARRPLALVFVALVLAAAAALAVPAARTAILEFFGLQGATVERVETLPDVSASALELGSPVPIVDGAVRTEWPDLLVPEELGPPDAAYYSSALPDGMVTLVYEPGEGVPRSAYSGVGLLVTEFRGDLYPGYVSKLAEAGTTVERLTVEGRPALWLEGGPHFVSFRAPDGSIVEERGRLAGNTLLVEQGRLLVRIEGEIERERAIAIARSLG